MVDVVMDNGIYIYFVGINIYYLFHLLNCDFQDVSYLYSIYMQTEKGKENKSEKKKKRKREIENYKCETAYKFRYLSFNLLLVKLNPP
jgi:hypothetical protein